MHPGLRTLIRLRIKARLRRMIRSLKTPRGMLLSLLAVGMLGLWLWPVIMAALFEGQTVHRTGLLAAGPDLLPIGLLLFSVMTIVTSANERAIYFAPNEVNLLFTGPFARRELLLYKIAMSVFGLLLGSIIFATMLLLYFRWWPAIYVGMSLTLLYLQLLGMVVALVGQMISDRLFTRARRAIGLVVLVLLGLGAATTLARTDAGNLLERIAVFRDHPVMVVLLAPFEVFAHTVNANRLWPDLLGWGSLALAIDLALLGLVIRLDANYLEAAALTSDRLYARLERMRSGGGPAMRVPKQARWSLPAPGWFGGVGPVAWRQVTTAIRTSRSFVLITAIAGIFGGGLAFSMRGLEGGALAAPLAAVGALAYSTLLLSLSIPLGFRGDLDRMETLKLLPLRPNAIAWGQLLGPALAMTFAHLLLLAVFAVILRGSYDILAVAAVFALPFNVLMLGVSNLIFLIFPVRVAPASPGDLQHLGRNMLFFVLLMLSMLVSLAVGGGVGILLFFVTGQSWPVALLGAWVTVVAELFVGVAAVAWAFQRFDVSRHIPA